VTCHLEFDARHRVVRARFDGTLTRGDIESMIVRVGAFMARYSGCHGIVDFSDVQAVSLDEAYLRELGRGRRIKAMQGFRRVLVAPKSNTRTFLQHYAQQQERLGHPVEIVDSLTEACARLGLEAPDFRPLAEAVSAKAAS
jgi:hypothetical protein